MASQESEYLKLFLEDAEDQLLALNRCMLELEKSPDDRALLDELFRCAHNLKGGSATMGFCNMEKLTHEMENVLGSMRNGEIVVKPEIADCLFQCLDRLNRMVETISCGEGDNTEVSGQCELLRKLLLEGSCPVGEAACDDSSACGSGNECGAELSKILSNLSEYDRLVVSDEIAQGRRVVEAIVYVSESASMRSARAFVIYNNLKSVGDALKYYPDIEDFEESDKHTSFYYLLATTETDEAIKECIGSGDIDFVELLNAEEVIGNGGDEAIQDAEPAGETPAPDVAAAEEERTLRTAEQPAAPAVEKLREAEPEKPARQQQAAAAPAAQDAERNAAPAKALSTLRVDTDRLDLIMNLVGELVINKTRFAQVRLEMGALEDELMETGATHKLSQRLKNLNSEFDITYQQIGRIAGDLQTRVMQIRMLPISNVFLRFERVVRDLARQSGRQVELEISGQDTELDKTVIEVIGDPLMHIVRNAIAHGLETPEERVAAGKPPTGHIHLRAYHEGNHVIIEVEEDGRGINTEKLKATALRMGMLTQEQADKLTEKEAINLIFMPSFSTTESADNVSGRGVGMDVVSRNIERLNGAVDVRTEAGKGTCFMIRIPLTLATIQALLVSVSGEIFAIPLVNIVETVRIHPGDIDKIEGREVTLLRNKVLSLLRLDDVLGFEKAPDKKFIYVVVVGIGEKRVGLIVHKLIGQQEIVIKSLGDDFGDVAAVAGASILGDGRVSLILDIYSLVEAGVKHVNLEVESRKRHKASSGGR